MVKPSQDNPNFISLYKNYCKHAKKRKLSWELSIDQFYKITQKVCYLCGSKPNNRYRHSAKHKAHKNPFIYNGIDRVNNQEGYTLKNCKPCCKKCNLIKRNYKIKDIKKHLSLIVGNLICK